LEDIKFNLLELTHVLDNGNATEFGQETAKCEPPEADFDDEYNPTLNLVYLYQCFENRKVKLKLAKNMKVVNKVSCRSFCLFIIDLES